MGFATTLVLLACSICTAVALAQNSSTVLACNLNAISSAERPRYNELVKRIRKAVRERTELANGYKLRLASDTVTLREVAEWVGLERLCCPFLTLELAAAGNQTDWTLTLTGPAGVKPIIAAEFPSD